MITTQFHNKMNQSVIKTRLKRYLVWSRVTTEYNYVSNVVHEFGVPGSFLMLANMFSFHKSLLIIGW